MEEEAVRQPLHLRAQPSLFTFPLGAPSVAIFSLHVRDIFELFIFGSLLEFVIRLLPYLQKRFFAFQVKTY